MSYSFFSLIIHESWPDGLYCPVHSLLILWMIMITHQHCTLYLLLASESEYVWTMKHNTNAHSEIDELLTLLSLWYIIVWHVQTLLQSLERREGKLLNCGREITLRASYSHKKLKQKQAMDVQIQFIIICRSIHLCTNLTSKTSVFFLQRWIATQDWETIVFNAWFFKLSNEIQMILNWTSPIRFQSNNIIKFRPILFVLF